MGWPVGNFLDNSMPLKGHLGAYQLTRNFSFAKLQIS